VIHSCCNTLSLSGHARELDPFGSGYAMLCYERIFYT